MSETVTQCEMTVGGMDCASCADTIKRSLFTLDGVQEVNVDVMGGKVRVQYAAGKLSRSHLSGAIQRAGHTVADEEQAAPPTFWARRGNFVVTAISGVLLAAGFLLGWLGMGREVTVPLLALATIAGGWFIVPRGLRAARNRALDMNFLMTIAAVGAFGIGEFGEAASAMFLFAVAQLLESYSIDRARNAIRALMDLSPPEARVLRGGSEVTVPIADVAVGETVVVRPGEKLPVDGVVVLGRSSVNQAPITGESMPVDKDAGSDVFAGTLNGHGSLQIRSTKPASDSTLARIIHAVEEAQSARAPSQTFVDRFARVYTPVVVVAAVLLAVVPPLLGLGLWTTWLYRALTMLVVACPCALVISTPVSFVSGLARSARDGILVKGGAHLENLAAVRVVAFDKTGTLTEGRPAVTDVVPLGGHSETDLLRLAMGIEHHSEHPLAMAVLALGAERGIATPASSDFEALVGRGARATVEGRTAWLGNQRLGQEQGGGTAEVTRVMERLESEGKTAVLLTAEDAVRTIVPVGVLAFADRPRPEARWALSELRDAGIARIVMLTGDNAGTARAIGGLLGVDEVRAELLPDDKVNVVRALEEGGTRVAFVGDGVNDAPALAAATVGIAMGAAGTDVAIETADVALMADNLGKLPQAISLSRRTLAIVKQNVIFSIGSKAVFIVLAATGLATLWMAVAADAGASVIVVANGLRMLRASRTRSRPPLELLGDDARADAAHRRAA